MVAAALVLAAFGIVAVLAPMIVPHDPDLQDLSQRIRPPVWTREGIGGHLLGTDFLGRDLFSRLIAGSRITLLVGLSTVLLGALTGGVIGLLSGFLGGSIDSVLMRLADIQVAIPYILVTIALVAVLGPSVPTVIGVLGLASWPVYARTVRGAVLVVKQREYVAAAEALGASSARILFRHVARNVLGPLVVITTLQVSQMLIAEASLSFLGLGVPLDTPTWGGMIREAQNYLFVAPWIAVWPGAALSLVVIATNFLGDALNDRLASA